MKQTMLISAELLAATRSDDEIGKKEKPDFGYRSGHFFYRQMLRMDLNVNANKTQHCSIIFLKR